MLNIEMLLTTLDAFLTTPIIAAIFGLIGAVLLEGIKLAIRGRQTHRNSVNREIWEMKRDVFIRTLNFVDGYWSNLTGWKDTPAPQERPTIKEAREILSLLSLTSKNIETVEEFLNCFGTESETASSGESDSPSTINMGQIQKLRNAMRLELGLGKINLDKEEAFITRLPWDDPTPPQHPKANTASD